MSALKYWIWLSSADVSINAKAAMLQYFGDAERAFMAPPGAFEKVEKLSEHDRALLEKRDLSGVDEILEKCEMQNLSVITYQDAAYPKRLRMVYAPPCVLYVRGRMPSIDENAVISVIGTRSCTPYGTKMGRSIASEIAECGGIVASGLTRGIEAAGVDGVLRSGGVVIGVLGTSHERDTNVLSADVAVNGAVISEYPPTSEQRRSHFRERNRITAGISVGVVVVEAPEGSHTRLFVQDAAEQGKEIFAVPGNADAENSVETNVMIKEGAGIVTCGWDILEGFQPLFPGKLGKRGSMNRLARCAEPEIPYKEKEKPLPKSKKPESEPPLTKKEVDKEKDRGYIDLREQLSELTEDQLKIITAVERSATHIDDIIETTGLSTAKVLAQLTVLEIRGYIRREAGKRIALNITKK